MSHLVKEVALVFGTLIALLIPLQPAHTQPIIPATDGTGTTISINGNQVDITNGTQAGANLFHSFEQFGLNQGQIANFLSNPQIQTILARVTGGDPSIIHGLVQVSGGTANLYLMNPAGILFGPTASLNVPASFTATTATGIGIGNQWFNAVGNNDYAALTGTPDGFAFTADQPGSLVNAGQLTVPNGQRVLLLGGLVINTGTITAPGGTVTIAAIPGEKLVRVSQQGSLLSLDLPQASAGTLPTPGSIAPATLPSLLTGGLGNATTVTVNNGQITLTGSGVSIPSTSGTTLISGAISTTSSTAGAGQVTLLGDRVNLISATINASGLTNGGTLLVGGDYQGQGTIPNAQQTYISANSSLQANAGQIGNGGRVIVWADDTTNFAGSISARGGAIAGNGGLVEVSGKENLSFTGAVNVLAYSGQNGTILLDPTNITIATNGGISNATTTVLDAAALTALAGNILIQATNDIEILTGVSLNFTAAASVTFTADSDQSGAGSFFMSPQDAIITAGKPLSISGVNVTLGTLQTTAASGTGSGGNIEVTAQGLVKIGNIDTSTDIFYDASGQPVAKGGNVTIRTLGPIETGDLLTAFGDVEITGSSITTGNINTFPQVGGDAFVEDGKVTLRSTVGDIVVKTIRSGAEGIDINAARLFRATDYFIVGLPLSEFDTAVVLKSSPALIALFKQKLITPNLTPAEAAALSQAIETSSAEILFFTQNIPVSVLATADDFTPATRITIQHGGQSLTPANTSIAVTGQGGAFGFVAGPRVQPAIADPYTPTLLGGWAAIDLNTIQTSSVITLYRNETYTPLTLSNQIASTLQDPNALPQDVSGTVGAILIANDINNLIVITSLRDRPFIPGLTQGIAGNSTPGLIPSNSAAATASSGPAVSRGSLSNEITQPRLTLDVANTSCEDTSGEEKGCVDSGADNTLLQVQQPEGPVPKNYDIAPRHLKPLPW